MKASERFVETLIDCYLPPKPESSELTASQLAYFTEISQALIPSSPPPKDQHRLKINYYTICGLAGVGKTEIAAHWVKTHERDFSAIAWIPKDPVDFQMEKGEYYYVKHFREYTGPPESRQRIQKTHWNPQRRAAAKEKPWLLVFDDTSLGQLKLLADWLPDCSLVPEVSILITSRDPEFVQASVPWGSTPAGIVVQPLDIDDAAAFFRSLTPRRKYDEKDQDLPVSVAKKTGGMPAAIVHLVEHITCKDKAFPDTAEVLGYLGDDLIEELCDCDHDNWPRNLVSKTYDEIALKSNYKPTLGSILEPGQLELNTPIEDMFKHPPENALSQVLAYCDAKGLYKQILDDRSGGKSKWRAGPIQEIARWLESHGRITIIDKDFYAMPCVAQAVVRSRIGGDGESFGADKNRLAEAQQQRKKQVKFLVEHFHAVWNAVGSRDSESLGISRDHLLPHIASFHEHSTMLLAPMAEPGLEQLMADVDLYLSQKSVSQLSTVEKEYQERTAEQKQRAYNLGERRRMEALGQNR